MNEDESGGFWTDGQVRLILKTAVQGAIESALKQEKADQPQKNELLTVLPGGGGPQLNDGVLYFDLEGGTANPVAIARAQSGGSLIVEVMNNIHPNYITIPSNSYVTMRDYSSTSQDIVDVIKTMEANFTTDTGIDRWTTTMVSENAGSIPYSSSSVDTIDKYKINSPSGWSEKIHLLEIGTSTSSLTKVGVMVRATDNSTNRFLEQWFMRSDLVPPTGNNKVWISNSSQDFASTLGAVGDASGTTWRYRRYASHYRRCTRYI